MFGLRRFSKLRGYSVRNSLPSHSHPSSSPLLFQSSRFISSTNIIQESNNNNVSIPDVSDVITNSNNPTITTTTTTNTTTTTSTINSEIIDTLPVLGNYPSDLICKGLEGLHTLTALPYWQTILVGTILVRLALLPSTIISQKGTSKITFIKSEIDKLNKLAEANPQKKSIYDQEISYLYKKHKINPFSGFLNPLLQFPIFISTFFALRQMGTYFPEYGAEGAFWLTGLAAADPMYILPIVNALSLLAITEIGVQNIDINSSPWFKPVMRGMSIVSIPITMSLPSGLLLFWCTNNFISIAQTIIFKEPSVMKLLDIYPPPSRPPSLKITSKSFKNIFSALMNNSPNTVEFIGKNQKTVDNTATSYNPQKKRAAAAAASTTVASSSSSSNSNKETSSLDFEVSQKSASEPPPKTYATPPKKKVKPRL